MFQLIAIDFVQFDCIRFSTETYLIQFAFGLARLWWSIWLVTKFSFFSVIFSLLEHVFMGVYKSLEENCKIIFR